MAESGHVPKGSCETAAGSARAGSRGSFWEGFWAQFVTLEPPRHPLSLTAMPASSIGNMASALLLWVQLDFGAAMPTSRLLIKSLALEPASPPQLHNSRCSLLPVECLRFLDGAHLP